MFADAMQRFIKDYALLLQKEENNLTERKGLDLNHLTIIDEAEVPAKAKRYTPYRELLKRIRKGKAVVLSEDEVNIDTARAGIRRLQEKGEFKKITTVQRTQDGKKYLYIINPRPSEETEKTS